MDTQKRQHLQDIYASDRAVRDDFTPQVSSEILEERKREIRRHQFTSFMMGLIILALALALVYVVVKEYIDIQNESAAPAAITLNPIVPVARADHLSTADPSGIDTTTAGIAIAPIRTPI